MTPGSDLVTALAEQFAAVISEVDTTIGENRDYGAGIGPHDEDDQVDALAQAVSREQSFPGTLRTVRSDPTAVQYAGSQAADLVIEDGDTTVFMEAKLFRFQQANGTPSPQAFGKVFNPYQDRNPRSFLHDVPKLAGSDIRARKAFLGIYYRPVQGAGTEITGEEIAAKFAQDVDRHTEYSISVCTVAPFEGLQHPHHSRGAILTWLLEDQAKQWF